MNHTTAFKSIPSVASSANAKKASVCVEAVAVLVTDTSTTFIYVYNKNINGRLNVLHNEKCSQPTQPSLDYWLRES